MVNTEITYKNLKDMKRNFFKFILSVALMICCTAASAVGTKPPLGDGTTANPYQIATKDNLLWFADHVNQGNVTACAILMADITVNTGVLNNNGDLTGGTFEIWTPIGSWGSLFSSYNGYSGEFDGNGHTISGLYFSDDTRSAVGLFGMTNNYGNVTAYIHDVGIKDSYFRGKSHVAGICGDLANGKIVNCWSAATVQSTGGTTGGIAGSCWKHSSVFSCYNIGKVVEGTNCGGICGSVAKNTNVAYSVSHCVSLEGKCSVAYNLYDDAKIGNVTIKNNAAFANGEVCQLLGRHFTEHIAPSAAGQNEWHCRLCNKEFPDKSCILTNQIFYQSSNQLPLASESFESGLHTNAFGTDFESHKFTYGMGEILFKGYIFEIGYRAFFNSIDMTDISLPNSITSIGEEAFACCYKLQSIVIPDNVTKIGKMAFLNCENLKNVTIPNSVTEIGNLAFQDCNKALTSIKIPSSVTSIGASAFNGCKQLTRVYVGWRDANKIPALQTLDDFPYVTCDLYVPTGMKSVYQSKEYWNIFRNIYEYSSGLLLGDANNDGIINVNDITTIAEYILKGSATNFNFANADVNSDGIINVNDITGVASIILKK